MMKEGWVSSGRSTHPGDMWTDEFALSCSIVSSKTIDENGCDESPNKFLNSVVQPVQGWRYV